MICGRKSGEAQLPLPLVSKEGRLGSRPTASVSIRKPLELGSRGSLLVLGWKGRCRLPLHYGIRKRRGDGVALPIRF